MYEALNEIILRSTQVIINTAKEKQKKNFPLETHLRCILVRGAQRPFFVKSELN